MWASYWRLPEAKLSLDSPVCNQRLENREKQISKQKSKLSGGRRGGKMRRMGAKWLHSKPQITQTCSNCIHSLRGPSGPPQRRRACLRHSRACSTSARRPGSSPPPCPCGTRPGETPRPILPWTLRPPGLVAEIRAGGIPLQPPDAALTSLGHVAWRHYGHLGLLRKSGLRPSRYASRPSWPSCVM